MRCLTFSDLSLGSEFAGGCRCREQRRVELSLSLFQTPPPPPTWSPTCSTPAANGRGRSAPGRGGKGGESERWSGRWWLESLWLCPRLRKKITVFISAAPRRNRGGSHCCVKSLGAQKGRQKERQKKKKSLCHSAKWWSRDSDSYPEETCQGFDRCLLYWAAMMTF